MENSPYCSKIIYSRNLEPEILSVISEYPDGKVFLATEETVNKIWIAQFDNFFRRNKILKVVIPAGEHNKKIDSVCKIWEFLSQNGAHRKSLIINIGGGMLTDLAAFAATTFKRGIDFINVPTTLLSQVDASVGGKTGINFNGLKNEIGTFKEPVAVFINPDFLRTLDRENFLSGYAEMIKHGLIHNTEHLNELMEFDFDKMDDKVLQEMIRHSVNIKEYFVANDPTEKNIRKALNFGHTAGHAFESYAMQMNRPILHGFAVAYGMMAELYLSVKKCGFPAEELNKISVYLKGLYGKPVLSESDYNPLFQFMIHDKKNDSGNINFTLLPQTGKIVINQHCEKELVFEALQYCQNI